MSPPSLTSDTLDLPPNETQRIDWTLSGGFPHADQKSNISDTRHYPRNLHLKVRDFARTSKEAFQSLALDEERKIHMDGLNIYILGYGRKEAPRALITLMTSFVHSTTIRIRASCTS